MLHRRGLLWPWDPLQDLDSLRHERNHMDVISFVFAGRNYHHGLAHINPFRAC